MPLTEIIIRKPGGEFFKKVIDLEDKDILFPMPKNKTVHNKKIDTSYSFQLAIPKKKQTSQTKENTMTKIDAPSIQDRDVYFRPEDGYLYLRINANGNMFNFCFYNTLDDALFNQNIKAELKNFNSFAAEYFVKNLQLVGTAIN